MLKQLFKDFDVFGGAEFRIAAADSDVKVGSNGAIIAGMVPPNLESVRGRINAGGKLPIDPQAPAELSISLTDDPSEMGIRWATQAQGLTGARVEAIGCVPCTTDAKLAPGHDNDLCNRTFAATASTYTVPQKWWPIFNGSLYEAIISGLVPGSRNVCSYRVGSDAALSAIRSFSPPPTPGEPTTVAVIADQGTIMPLGFATTEKLAAVQDNLPPFFSSFRAGGISSSCDDTVSCDSSSSSSSSAAASSASANPSSLRAQRPTRASMAVHVGDLSYAGIDTAFPHLNISKDDEFENIWDLWQVQNEPIAATRPYMIGIGNHEAWYNWTSVTSRFTMPRGESDYADFDDDNHDSNDKNLAAPPFWWSMDHGLAHWVMLCSEFPLDANSRQGKWLRNDLKWANARHQKDETNDGCNLHELEPRRCPWIVVTIHRPLYSSDRSWIDLRLELEPLFKEFRVDLVLSGHMHAYERTHGVAANGSRIIMPTRSLYATGGHSTADAVPSNSDQDDCVVDVYENLLPGVPLYVTQGNSGAVQSERWERPAPDWSAVRWANGHAENWRQESDFDSRQINTKIYSDLRPGERLPRHYSDTFGFGLVSFLNATAMLYESVPITGTFCDKFMVVRAIPGAVGC